MWPLSVSIYLIITLCLWHISYENCFISSDICLETSNFFLYLQTKIMWYCNRYLCLFLDFHVPMPWVYNNFWFLATLTHRLKPVGLRYPYFKGSRFYMCYNANPHSCKHYSCANPHSLIIIFLRNPRSYRLCLVIFTFIHI